MILDHSSTFPVAMFLAQAVFVSLSGVMAPGPITAATLAAGVRRRHAGAWIAVGHAVVEFPLMVLLVAVAGVGRLLKTSAFQAGVGLAGGIVLLVLAALTALSLRKPVPKDADCRADNPLWTGIALSGGNPYFLVWWATVGLLLATQASSFGVAVFIAFAIVHWTCDLVWYEVLSLASNKGARWLGPMAHRVLTIVCAAGMAVFAAWFLIDAFGRLR